MTAQAMRCGLQQYLTSETAAFALLTGLAIARFLFVADQTCTNTEPV
jgi:hypothetical protein